MSKIKKQPNNKDYIVLAPTEEKIITLLSYKEEGLSISELSKNTKLARTSIYNSINSLIKKKLVIKKEFIYKLIDLNLTKIKSEKADPQKQIMNLMAEILKLNHGDTVHSIESEEEIKKIFESKKEFLEWQKIAVKKEIIFKGIGTKQSLKIFQSMIEGNLKEEIKKRSGSARFTNNEIKGPCTLISFKNTVVFFSRTKNFYHRVDDHTVAKFTQSIIDILYGDLEYQPLVQNQA